MNPLYKEVFFKSTTDFSDNSLIQNNSTSKNDISYDSNFNDKNIGVNAINSAAALHSKFNYKPSWGWEHTPHFVNLTPIVKGLTSTLDALEINVGQNNNSPNENQKTEPSFSNNSYENIKITYDALTPITQKPIEIVAIREALLNTKNAAQKKLVHLEHFQAENTRGVNFKARVKNLLKDFGFKDDNLM